MAEEAKETIYVDIDDEITNVIDKVQASDKKVVALVLPKRAPVFQSIVNMKLLKRKSDQAKKNIVLVTTESGILPLAGAVGVYVSKTLASKPEIPEAPEKIDHFVNADEDEPIEMESETSEPEEAEAGAAAAAATEAVDLKAIADEPVGKLSKKPIEEDTIELDNEALAAEDAAAGAAAAVKSKKAKKDKHLKVPNFEKFRMLIFLGVGLIILVVVLFILAFKFLPKATIDISTNAQNVATNVNINLSTAASSADISTNTIPAKQATENKTYTSTVNTTGQSTAQSASGTINITAQQCGGAHPPNSDIPAGTTVTQGGFSYTTQSDTTLLGPTASAGCFDYSGSTTIVADSAGSGSNTGSGTAFKVNYSNEPSDVTLSSSGSTSGGTNSGQVVAQEDINSAENKITTDNNGAKSDLESQLNQAGYQPLDVTFTAGSPNVSTSSPVGSSASTVTVTETVAYSEYGVKSNDLKSLVDASINSQVGANQSILDSGLSGAVFSVGSSPTSINMQTKAVVGPNINVAQLKHKIIGYKSADVQSLILENSNVTSVKVHFSPFFVSTVPSNVNRITINISKPNTP